MSYDMLFSEHFIAHPELVEFGVDREETMQDRYERLQNLLKVRQNIAPNKIKGVVLEHFHWHRIVADEYDEMNLLHFQDYQRTYAWCVSGTPEIDYNAMQFIGLIRLSTDPDLPEGISPGIVKEYEDIIFTEGQIYKKKLKKQLILEKLFWRNTKESVRGEFEMVETIQSVIRLDFTPLETTIYEYLKNHPDGSFGETEKKLMNFCCQLSDETNEANISLQHLKDEYISILKNDIASKERYLDELRNKYLRAVKDLNDKFMSWRHRECKNIISNYPEACESEKHLYIDFFEETLAKLQSQKASRFKSPLIDKYGTKLGNLVLFLRQLFREDDEARVIIISKHGTYLRLIGSILKASRIKYTVAGGNVLVKANAIRKFKEENVRVIMLDLNTGTSGLSLIEASHVILVDPISDDGDEALAYERRAIGYVKRQGQEQDVMVVKFIVSNTIEEKNYSNYADCALLARIRASST